MDTSSRDVAQIWIVEEATDQIAEFLQPAHGSNGFVSEGPFVLVDTGATCAVCFDVLPDPLVGVEFGQVGRELEPAQLSLGRSHKVLDCFGPPDRMAVAPPPLFTGAFKKTLPPAAPIEKASELPFKTGAFR